MRRLAISLSPEFKDAGGTRSDAIKTNGYAYSVNGGSNSTLSYDLNGNMLSDGTNSYSWDAENRMIKITYPGTNNFSSFVYDGKGRNVSIVETTGGSVTSTKQFVWAQDKLRPNHPCESRNATGTITAQYFGHGETISGTNYYWNKDHLGSIRELTNASGAIQAQYVYDPYGRVTKISEAIAADFGYAGYYLHARSGLSLTRTRAYNAILGRFINRDSIEESGGLNLFAYVNNNPDSFVDPVGTLAGPIIPVVVVVVTVIIGGIIIVTIITGVINSNQSHPAPTPMPVIINESVALSATLSY